MSTEQIDQPQRDRRSAYRCPAPASHQEATLKTEQEEFPVQLLDESAVGFAVRIQGPLSVEANDVVRLRTISGWFEVRVANVAEEPAAESDLEAGESDDRQSSDPPAPTFRLGLHRLKDVDPWDEPAARTSWFNRLPLVSLTSRENPLVLFGFGAIVLGGAIVLAAVFFPRGSDSPVTKWSNRLFKSSRSASSSQNLLPPRLTKQLSKMGRSAVKAIPSSIVPDAAARGSAPATGTAKQVSGGGNGKSSLHGTIRRFSGATVFTLPDVVKELSLTDTQQAEIKKIIDASSEALQHIERHWTAGSRRQRAKTRTMVHDEARRRALKVLTADQHDQWKKLHAASSDQ